MTPKFLGKIIDYKLVLNDKPAFDKYGETLNGKDIELVLRERTNQRSINQNSFYRGVVVKLTSEHTGHTPDEVHEIFKRMFLTKWITLKTKTEEKEILITQSTTVLTTKEFGIYIDSIVHFASVDLGLYIPTAGEVDY